MKREEIWSGEATCTSTATSGHESAAKSALVSQWLVHTSTGYEIRFEADKVGLNISTWFEYHRLALTLAYAMYEICKTVSVGSRITMEGDFRRGFLAFLAERKFSKYSGLEDITSDLFAAFVEWLRGGTRNSVKKRKSAKSFSIANQKKYFLIAKRIFEFIIRDPDIGAYMPPDFEMPSTYLAPEPRAAGRPIIPAEHFAALLRAAEGEVMEKMERLTRVWNEKALRLAEIKEMKRPAVLDYSVLVDVLIALDDLFGKQPFMQSALKRKNPRLYCSLQMHGGGDAVCEYRYPTSRGLVPFVRMIAVFTSFNPETVRGLDSNSVIYSSIFQKERVNLFGVKARSNNTPQARSFSMDDPRGVSALLAFVERWTEPIRTLAPAPHRIRIFIFVIQMGRTALTVANWVTPSRRVAASHAWYEADAAFEKDHNLPHSPLAQLRGTSLDMVREISSNDLKAVQLAGGQKSINLIEAAYSSPTNRARNDERLVKIIDARTRWVSTNGKSVDHRQEPSGVDMGAITPGFGCLDPYDSPVVGEHKGRLCQAYGCCPNCALGYVDFRDPHSLCRLVQLAGQLHIARGLVAPQRWVYLWAPQLARLENYWLPIFDEAIWEKAKHLTLGPIPSIE